MEKSLIDLRKTLKEYNHAQIAKSLHRTHDMEMISAWEMAYVFKKDKMPPKKTIFYISDALAGIEEWPELSNNDTAVMLMRLAEVRGWR